MKQTIIIVFLLGAVAGPSSFAQSTGQDRRAYAPEAVITAARQGRNDLLEEWHAGGYSLEAYTGRLDKSALMVAVENGHHATVRLLVRYGADIHYKDRSKNPVLYYALHQPSMVQTLLSLGADPNGTIKPDDMPVAVYFAAFSQAPQALKHLLDAGADPAYVGPNSNMTALLYAVIMDNTGAARILLNAHEEGQYIGLYRKIGDKTAYQMAIERNSREMVQVFQEYGITK